MNDAASRWRALVQTLDANQPASSDLYVEPEHSPASRVVDDLLAIPGARTKSLLVGARGGGKSSELRKVADLLSREHMQVVTIDLDQSGVSAASVSAADLLYISAVGVLRILSARKPSEATTLFGELAAAYAPNQSESLGRLDEALKGLAEFAAGATKVATAASALDGGASLIAGTVATGAVAIGLRLADRKGEVVAESSPSGRALQAACEKIARSARGEGGDRLCVVIDGLEKINGGAGERLRQVFEQTRLVADAPWASVIAAPPCTLTETNSLDGRGYTTVPVWGFDPDQPARLRDLLARRFEARQLDIARCVEGNLLEDIARESGGLPRHAVTVARRAVLSAIHGGDEMLRRHHVSDGLDELGQALARGLDEDHYMALSHVARSGRLPGGNNKAATLFADGRILARAPSGGSRAPRFVVHPLLAADVRGYTPEE